MSLQATALDCNIIQLDSELGAIFEDRGGNACGCAGEPVTCSAQTSNIAPPAPLAPAGP